MLPTHDALHLLDALTEADGRWLVDASSERSVAAATAIVREGDRPAALWMLSAGLADVALARRPGQVVARLGPGEIVGEMAWLEDAPASATVTACEDTRLIEIPRAALEQKVAADPGFGARFYRALGLVLSRRLRRMTGGDEMPSAAGAAAAAWQALSPRIDAFKALTVEADKEAMRRGDVVPDATQSKITAGMTAFTRELNERIGDQSPLDPQTRAMLGQRVQRELLPFLLLSEIGERMYRKPRGYAGDFLTIDIMYRDQPGGTGRLGPAIDKAFRAHPANVAVMNRRGLLAEAIGKTVAAAGSGRAHVTSLAAGPAAELFDVFATLAEPARLKATCVDIDLQALAFVSDRAERLGLRKQIDLHHGNLVYLAMGRRQLDLPPQDLIYSIGLIDYFADKFVRLLLDWIHDRLRPGGRVILGNFHSANVDKALMDHVLEWQLIHRSEEDMHALFASSKFGRPCTAIRFEPQRVNLFAECVKE